MRRNLHVLVLTALISLTATPSQAQLCEPTSETRQSLKRLGISGVYGDNLISQQKAILAELLTQHPDDVFLHLRYVQVAASTTDADRAAVIARYKQLADAHPGNPDYAYLYAVALVGSNTPDAIARLKTIASGSPSYPLASLELASIYRWGKLANHAESRAQLELFLEACPASFNSTAVGLLGDAATPEMAARYAPALRERLLKENDLDRIRIWESVWSLEFKARPPTEHAEVRKQIAGDLARLEQNFPAKDVHLLNTLLAGYKMLGDEALLRRIEDRVVADDPHSYAARGILSDRWNKQHPYPKSDAPKPAKQAYYRASLQHYDELLKSSPGDSDYLNERFWALSALDDSSAKQIVAAAKALQAALRGGADWYSSPPVEFQIADAYLKHRTHVSEVPALVASGLISDHNRPGARLTSDNEPDEWRKMIAENDFSIKTRAAELLLDAAKQLKQPASAKAAVDDLADAKPENPDSQATLWELRAKWAELNGRKLDALLMFRNALDLRSPPSEPSNEDELAANFARLWSELGGTAETEKLLAKRSAPREATTEGRWESQTKDMPGWELTDLAGHTWTAASLHGKAVLINVWATWCGPCRQEHPLLQSLYDKIKNNSDIQVLTFDIDDEIGNVAPYMAKNNYSFPVLLAKDFVNDLLPDIAIPRLWIVDAAGKWRWEQVGMSSDDANWEKQLLEKLDSVKPH